MGNSEANDAHPFLPRVPGTTKRALITGITGQDGSYLAELLLAKGYEVHGIVRRSSSFNTDRIDHLYQDPHESGVGSSPTTATCATRRAGRSSSTSCSPTRSTTSAPSPTSGSRSTSPSTPPRSSAPAALRLLEAIREAGVSPRFYQASSSEMFGAAPPPQSETDALPPP